MGDIPVDEIDAVMVSQRLPACPHHLPAHQILGLTLQEGPTCPSTYTQNSAPLAAPATRAMGCVAAGFGEQAGAVGDRHEPTFTACEWGRGGSLSLPTYLPACRLLQSSSAAAVREMAQLGAPGGAAAGVW